MHLSDFQKEVIKTIINGESNDIESFLIKFCELEMIHNVDYNGFTEYGRFEKNIPVFITKDEASALNKTKEFITLWKIGRRQAAHVRAADH